MDTRSKSQQEYKGFYKELNSTNKLNELESGFFCRASKQEFSLIETLNVTLSREPS